MKKPARRPRFVGMNPVQVAVIRKGIKTDVAALEVSAKLHAITGANAAKLVNEAGRLSFIVGHAAAACGISESHPDMRIVRGLAEALGDLAADLRSLEQHRPAILSGCEALSRLLPLCNDWTLGTAAIELDHLLATAEGMGTSDIRRAMGIA